MQKTVLIFFKSGKEKKVKVFGNGEKAVHVADNLKETLKGNHTVLAPQPAS